MNQKNVILSAAAFSAGVQAGYGTSLQRHIVPVLRAVVVFPHRVALYLVGSCQQQWRERRQQHQQHQRGSKRRCCAGVGVGGRGGCVGDSAVGGGQP